MYCNVLITKPFDQYFTYKFNIHQRISRGNLVFVPFGNKNDQIGLVCEVFESLPKKLEKFEIKEVSLVFENITLNEKTFNFLEWIAKYTLAPKGLVLKLIIINNKIIEHNLIKSEKNIFSINKVKLNKEQTKAFNVIKK